MVLLRMELRKSIDRFWCLKSHLLADCLLQAPKELDTVDTLEIFANLQSGKNAEKENEKKVTLLRFCYITQGRVDGKGIRNLNLEKEEGWNDAKIESLS
jgi:hypothetical protein